jgi:hypothetical protein
MDNSQGANVMHRLIAFKANEEFATALKRAADRQFISVSDYIRQNMAAPLRRAGLLEE